MIENSQIRYDIGKVFIKKSILQLELEYYLNEYKNYKFILGKCNKNIDLYEKQRISMNLISKKIWFESETIRIESYLSKKQNDRLFEWLLSRYLLKMGFLIYLSIEGFELIELNTISIENDSNKKPFLVLHNNFINRNSFKLKIPSISISHSNSYIIISISKNKIGLDCEDINRRSSQFVDKIVNIEERDFLSEKIQLKYMDNINFLPNLIWTIKESRLKLDYANKEINISQIKLVLINNEIYTEIPNINLLKNILVYIFDNSIISISF